MEAHWLKYPKYVRRLRKFNDKNDIDSMSEKMYENARKCLYQIEVHMVGLKAINNHYTGKRFWTRKEIKVLILFIRKAYPDNWFKKRASRAWRDMQKKAVEKPKWQFDIDFNKVTNE